jgi:hypothetical protein
MFSILFYFIFVKFRNQLVNQPVKAEIGLIWDDEEISSVILTI